jgi:hypothetical protein
MNDQLTRRNSDHIMHERIAKLETKVDRIHEDLNSHTKEEDKDRKELIAEIRCIKAEQNKQKGFIAGVSAAVSAIIIAIGMALKWFQS